MAKPTEGPYEVVDSLTISAPAGWAAYPTKTIIATVRPYPRTPEAYAEGRANARLLAKSWEMREAFEALVMVCGKTGDAVTDFEEQAAAFQRATGKMRPGKDVPAAAADIGATPEEYGAWAESKLTAARSLLREIQGDSQ